MRENDVILSNVIEMEFDKLQWRHAGTCSDLLQNIPRQFYQGRTKGEGWSTAN